MSVKVIRNSLLGILAVVFLQLLNETIAIAQVEAPDRDFVFFEDKKKKKDDKKRQRDFQQKQKALRARQERGLPFDINATTVDYDSTLKNVKAEGGLIAAYGSTVLEAEQGLFNTETHDVELSGDVRISDLTGNLLADSVKLNLDSGIGSLKNPLVYFENGGYRVWAAEADKVGKEDYQFTDATLSTCGCPEDESCRPWSITGSRAKVTRNGYGQIWNGTLSVYDVPVLYLPYLIFPAKTERQSGLLPFTFGNGKKNGFEMFVPLYLVFDRSSDATLTGIMQTNSRYGLETEFRQAFSARNRLQMGLTYLNESPRGEDLQGTSLDGLADPEILKERFAGYLDANATASILDHRYQFIANGNYVNDDLILREFNQPKIGPYNARYVTSRALMRTDILDSYSLETAAEFNQAMVENDEILFQTLPEIDVSGLHVFRPFGDNPLGAKLVLENGVNSTYFDRQIGYQGFRNELSERVKLPFHIRNYLEAEASADLRGSLYELSEVQDVKLNSEGKPELTDELQKSTDRAVPGASFKASTTLERVFEVGEVNLLSRIVELGKIGRDQKLVRLKHTLEPGVRYRYVPDIDQSDNPRFDSGDRLEERNVVTYQLVQRLFGRYERRDRYAYGIEEATPEAEDIPELEQSGPLDERLAFGYEERSSSSYRNTILGSRKELVNLSISQSYDIVEADRELADPTPDGSLDSREPFSDVSLGVSLYPNEYIRLRALTNIDPDTRDFSSYSVESQLSDKRGDELRTRFTFISDNIRQVENGLEFLVTDRVKLGWYARYDDISREFLENKFGVRLLSSCNCWKLDLQYVDRLNPDERAFLFTMTLTGLGEVTDRLFSDEYRRNEQRS